MRLEELHVRNRVVAHRLAHVGTAPPAEPPTAKHVRRLPEALRIGMRREARRRTLWWKVRAAGCVVFGAQFVVLVAISMFFYNRFNLGIDFAIFNQAWTQIGHGNLDPYSTIQSVSFLHLNFDIVMWPLGALYRIFPQPSLLLWVQAGALAGTGLVCFFWISELLERRSLHRGPALGLLGGALALWLLNPATYAVANQDFHAEPIGALFAVLAARDLWRGNLRRSWWWIAGCLLCGENGSLYVLGIALSCLLAGRSTRRRGLLLAGIGLGAIVFIDIIGANAGPKDGYAWLAGRSTLPGGLAGVSLLVSSLFEHPSRGLNMVFSKRISMLYGWLRPVGIIGIVTPWGFGVPVLVLLASALQKSPVFLIFSFQDYVVYAFLLFGACALISGPLAAMIRHRQRKMWVTSAVLALSAALVVGAIFYASEDYSWVFRDHGFNGQVAPAAADALNEALVRIPSDAEVIAPIAISGRFGGRRYIYLYLYQNQVFPVHAREVVIVLSADYGLSVTGPVSWGAGGYLRSIGARNLVDRNGIWVLVWRPPKGTTSLQILG